MTSGSRTTSATSSNAARSTRRSSHSTISSVMPADAVPGAPHFSSRCCSDDRVDVEVNSANGIGVEREAVQQGPFGDEVVGVDENHDSVIRMFMVAARPLTASKARSSRTYCLFSRINAMYMKGPTTAMIHAPR